MRFLLILTLTAATLCACQENFDKRLEREAREFTTNHCPQEPEPGSRLDSTVYHPTERVYSTYYSLNADNELMLRSNTPLLRRSLLNQLRDDVNHKALKDKKITFEYVYRSQETGMIVYETRISAAEYLPR